MGTFVGRAGRCVVAFALCAVGTAAVQPEAVSGPSGEAKAHLEEVIATLQAHWLRRATMDWDRFRAQVLDAARSARTVPDTYDAIRVALRLLGDKHSYYLPAAGAPIFNPESPSQSTGQCDSTDPAVPILPPGVGYVRVQIRDAKAGADAIRRAIGERAGKSTPKWIVDLRNSRGGNMWPILAELGPILGTGTAGYFADAQGTLEPWGYVGDGAVELNAQTVAVGDARAKALDPAPRVAVLTDIGVASSGEAVAIAFRGRPNTRSFGMPTCGLSTAIQPIPLQTGGRLGVMTSVMVDREKHVYGGSIEPDERVVDPSTLIEQALAWLNR